MRAYVSSDIFICQQFSVKLFPRKFNLQQRNFSEITLSPLSQTAEEWWRGIVNYIRYVKCSFVSHIISLIEKDPRNGRQNRNGRRSRFYLCAMQEDNAATWCISVKIRVCFCARILYGRISVFLLPFWRPKSAFTMLRNMSRLGAVRISANETGLGSHLVL
jgi:hypothetical protein